MLNFYIFLKTKLKIYLFKLLKGAIISGACRFFGAKKVKSGSFQLTHRRDFVPQKGDTCAFRIKIRTLISML